MAGTTIPDPQQRSSLWSPVTSSYDNDNRCQCLCRYCVDDDDLPQPERPVRGRTPSPSSESTFTAPPVPSMKKMPRTPPQEIRDTQFWFNDGSALLVVDNITYRLHQGVLERQSVVLKQLFSTSGGYCIELNDISNSDFVEFLHIVYPSDFSARDNMTSDQWASVLRVATVLQAGAIRALAIKFLSSTAPHVDKIVLGDAYDVREWLNDSYKAVCERPECLTIEEGRKLGVDDVVRIMRARETGNFEELLSSLEPIVDVNGHQDQDPSPPPLNANYGIPPPTNPDYGIPPPPLVEDERKNAVSSKKKKKKK